MRREVKKLVEKADRLLRQVALYRDSYTCQLTGVSFKHEPAQLECAHYENRDNKRTRWELANVCMVRGYMHRATPEYKLNRWYERKFPNRAQYVNLIKRDLFFVKKKPMEKLCKMLEAKLKHHRSEYEEREKNSATCTE